MHANAHPRVSTHHLGDCVILQLFRVSLVHAAATVSNGCDSCDHACDTHSRNAVRRRRRTYETVCVFAEQVSDEFDVRYMLQRVCILDWWDVPPSSVSNNRITQKEYEAVVVDVSSTAGTTVSWRRRWCRCWRM
jgi:hypothetical protein